MGLPIPTLEKQTCAAEFRQTGNKTVPHVRLPKRIWRVCRMVTNRDRLTRSRTHRYFGSDHGSGYGAAVPRKDWDELIKGDDLLALLGDSEGQCIRNVYVGSIYWAEEHGGERDITYVFDKRPHREMENSLIFEVFRSLHEDKSITVEPVSLDFGLSSDAPPLQVADLFAWETYQHVKDVVTNGQKISEPNGRPCCDL